MVLSVAGNLTTLGQQRHHTQDDGDKDQLNAKRKSPLSLGDQATKRKCDHVRHHEAEHIDGHFLHYSLALRALMRSLNVPYRSSGCIASIPYSSNESTPDHGRHVVTGRLHDDAGTHLNGAIRVHVGLERDQNFDCTHDNGEKYEHTFPAKFLAHEKGQQGSEEAAQI
ncbi:hypothetical protein Tdes44962_MAKER02720 [Teratosphaeria destructans]|uniref:Uncharacterized protein n=1 Tax=Teratosphaeria destructans TaxID=418781 RepID=A0A9W7SSM7_9PEZI|nr:hypothetical protein Tdes44962_MAKER02720 [Teratosphaeria destructans]